MITVDYGVTVGKSIAGVARSYRILSAGIVAKV